MLNQKNLFLLAATALFLSSPCLAFVPHRQTNFVSTQTNSDVVAKTWNARKKQEEDLSFIESRDMTREEMLELNRQNEDIMNAELGAMTGFSLVLSLPILYLCWVAFFSE